MSKEMLAEDFMNASKEYTDFQTAMMEMFDDNPIISCLIGNLHRLADDYYMAMIRIYDEGMTLDEVLRQSARKEK